MRGDVQRDLQLSVRGHGDKGNDRDELRAIGWIVVGMVVFVEERHPWAKKRAGYLCVSVACPRQREVGLSQAPRGVYQGRIAEER